MKVVLSPNPYRDKGLKAAQSARRILQKAGCECCMCLPFDLERDSLELPAGLELLPAEEAFQGADVLICFGGDGTILHAAKAAQEHGLPVLGVNLGSVGFMAELESAELGLLTRLPEGKYTLEGRMMLEVSVRREGKVLFRDRALNDAVITKGAVARIIELDARADGIPVGKFSGDGLIVATPTGSTAYSLSSGGPVIEPSAENILITPICSHTIQAKSFVLDKARTVTVKLSKMARRTAFLSVDGGKAFRLGGNDTVELKMYPEKVKLIRLTNRNFYTVLNQKLGRS